MEDWGLSGTNGMNCTLPAIDDFPKDFFTEEERQSGAVVLHVIASLYLFVALAVVCDKYFVPAVEKICQALNMSNDVAGATFMAAATSAPELFVNVIGTFITEGDIGVGTIVGSAVFNILAVAACCGICAAMTIPLDWWPLTRDCVAYGVTVAILICIMHDERVEWYEALCLVLLYIVYISIMYFDKSFQKCARAGLKRARIRSRSQDSTYNPTKNSQDQGIIEARFACLKVDHIQQNGNINNSELSAVSTDCQKKNTNIVGVDITSAATITTATTTTANPMTSTTTTISTITTSSAPTSASVMINEKEKDISKTITSAIIDVKLNQLKDDEKQIKSDDKQQQITSPNSGETVTATLPAITTTATAAVGSDEKVTETNSYSLIRYPKEKSCFAQTTWIITWPIHLLFFFTIPDCEKKRNKKIFPLTFIMCIIWIGSLSYVVAWMITIIGDTLKIPDSVMGITFLAAGTSVPEAVSSVIVAKQGHGSMGICNSIGSNTFDILICLGVPWLIKAAFLPIQPGHHWVGINSAGLEYSAITLLSTLFLLYITFSLNKFRLDRKVGHACLIMYLVFLVFASLIELNVFFRVNLPTCGRT